MDHVLGLVPEPGAALREVSRSLKPGGRVLIEVPNVTSLDARVSKTLRANILDYPNHLYAFSPPVLKELVTGAGFRIIALETSFPFVLARIIGGVQRMLGRRATHALAREPRPAEVRGRELLLGARPDSLMKRMVSRVLPGMKMTVIAEKPAP